MSGEYQAIAELNARCADLERALALLIASHIEMAGGEVVLAARLLVRDGKPIRLVFTQLPDGRIDVSFAART